MTVHWNTHNNMRNLWLGKVARRGCGKMEFEAPFTSTVMRVEKDWIDYNGHLNMAFYNVLFDRGIDQALELLGLGQEYLDRTNASYFTIEAQVTYLRELQLDDPVTVSLHLLDYDSKRLHCFQTIHHAEENFLSATSETMSMHVDMGTKKSVPFPDEIARRAEAMLVAHKALDRYPQVGHVIGIPQKSN